MPIRREVIGAVAVHFLFGSILTIGHNPTPIRRTLCDAKAVTGPLTPTAASNCGGRIGDAKANTCPNTCPLTPTATSDCGGRIGDAKAITCPLTPNPPYPLFSEYHIPK